MKLNSLRGILPKISPFSSAKENNIHSNMYAESDWPVFKLGKRLFCLGGPPLWSHFRSFSENEPSSCQGSVSLSIISGYGICYCPVYDRICLFEHNFLIPLIKKALSGRGSLKLVFVKVLDLSWPFGRFCRSFAKILSTAWFASLHFTVFISHRLVFKERKERQKHWAQS